MLGTQHLAISASLTGVLVLATVMALPDLTLPLLALWLGVGAGSLLPDIDAEDAAINYQNVGKHFKALSILNPFVAALSRPMTPLAARALGRYGDVDTGHRGLTHSVPGLLLISTGWFLALLAPVLAYFLAEGALAWQLLLYPLGLFLGGTLHIYEDGLTVSGVRWMHPVDERRTRGKLKTKPRYKARDDPLLSRAHLATKFFLAGSVATLFAAVMVEKLELMLGVAAGGVVLLLLAGRVLFGARG